VSSFATCSGWEFNYNRQDLALPWGGLEQFDDVLRSTMNSDEFVAVGDGSGSRLLNFMDYVDSPHFVVLIGKRNCLAVGDAWDGEEVCV